MSRIRFIGEKPNYALELLTDAYWDAKGALERAKVQAQHPRRFANDYELIELEMKVASYGEALRKLGVEVPA